MRYSSLYFILLVISTLACEKPVPELPVVTEIGIVLDFEDDQYLLDNQWYPANLPLVGCTPVFNLHFNWEEDRIQLRYCAEAGYLLTETITLGNDHCQLSPAAIMPPVEDRAYVRIDLLLEEDFRYCLQENSALYYLHFDFE